MEDKHLLGRLLWSAFIMLSRYFGWKGAGYTHSIDRTELTDAHGHMRSVSDLDWLLNRLVNKANTCAQQTALWVFLRKLPQLLLLLLAHYVLHRAKHISAWIPTPTKRTITCCKCCNLTQYTQRSLKAWEGITLCTGSNGLNDCRLYSDLL